MTGGIVPFPRRKEIREILFVKSWDNWREREKGAGEDTNCIFSTGRGAGEEDRTDIGRTLG